MVVGQGHASGLADPPVNPALEIRPCEQRSETENLDADTLRLTLEALRDFTARHFPDQRLLELDAADSAPVDDLRAMYSAELGIHLLFLPVEYGGMGGGAFDVYRVCAQLAGVDVGIAVGMSVGSLGSDVISRGGTEAQRALWLSRIAAQGLLMAYAATEPEAGSDLGALKTVAEPVVEAGVVTGYRLTGKKQWISNGGIADHYSVLANAPAGPTWFIVDAGSPGFEHGRPENKHGLRTSNTTALFLDGVSVGADRRVGDADGQGLLVAQTVFGYSRLMVAALGLGAGWAALDRAIAYARTRIQAGGPLSEKQGYTHKLIVPNAVRLEAARALLEESAERIDAGEGALNTEGAVAKLMATVAGHAAADASIQALGGYGYTRDFMVEKIARDARITRIFEGTSEIMEMTIARDRWQLHLKTGGRHYHEQAAAMEAVHAAHPEVGADVVALAFRSLAETMERLRLGRLTRHQHLLFRLGDWIAHAECAASLSRRAQRAAGGRTHPKADARFTPAVQAAIARVFAREAALKVGEEGMRWLIGVGAGPASAVLEPALRIHDIRCAQHGLLADMDQVADALFPREAGD